MFDIDADIGMRVGLDLSGPRTANMWKCGFNKGAFPKVLLDYNVRNTPLPYVFLVINPCQCEAYWQVRADMSCLIGASQTG